MNLDKVKHEKVQFRKREVRGLHDFPSAQAHDAPPLKSASAPRRPAPQPKGGSGRGFLYALGFMVLLAAGGYGLLRHGIEGAALDKRATEILSSMAGSQFDVAVDGARIALTRQGRLAISASSLTVTDIGTGSTTAKAGAVDLGLSVTDLVRGNLEVSTVSLSDAHVVAPGPASSAAPGPVKPDAVIEAAFANLELFMRAVGGPRTGEIDLQGATLDLAAYGFEKPVAIETARLNRTADGGVSVQADVVHGERRMALAVTGNAGGEGREARIDGTLAPVAFDLTQDGWRGGEKVEKIRRIAGTAALTFSASGVEGTRTLRASLDVPDLAFAMRDRIDTAGNANINLELAEGTDKVEIRPSTLRLGRSAMRFEGAAGPAQGGGAARGYRYEILSNDAVLAPGDSAEPAVSFAAKVAGTFDPTAKRLEAREIALRTDKGAAVGEAAISFTGTRDPAIFLALTVPRMPVAELKQFWPAFAAHQARNYVLDKVAGGEIADGSLELNVQADRLGAAQPLTASELRIRTAVSNTRVDLVGELPPVRDASGSVAVDGNDTTITIDSGAAYLRSGRVANVSDTTVKLLNPKVKPFYADVDLNAAGKAQAIAELVSLKPIDAMKLVPFGPEDLGGDVKGRGTIRFPVIAGGKPVKTSYDVALDFAGLSIAKQKVSDGKGVVRVDGTRAEVEAEARIDGIPATIRMVEPVNGSGVKASRSVALELDDATRAKVAPGLNGIVKGPVYIDLAGAKGTSDTIVADLTKAEIDLPFAGWSKSRGIAATAGFVMKKDGDSVAIRDFSLKGKSFAMAGEIDISGGNLREARFSNVQLNQSDGLAVTVSRAKAGYAVTVSGDALDARSFIKQAKDIVASTSKKASNAPVSVNAKIKRLTGFNKEVLQNVVIKYSGRGSRIDTLQVNAASDSGGAVVLNNDTKGGKRSVALESTDAGSVLRFLDIYPRMRGGRISVALSSEGDGPLAGNVEARDFTLVDEPRLASLVAKPPKDGSGSLAQTIRKDIDTTKVSFDQGSFRIRKGTGYLEVDKGILRGNVIGTTFEGTVYDKNGAMNINGTFMPAYGINRIFGDIPIVGEILGNGSDKGLIGITYKLAGPAKNPNILVNPVSLIAPGIFRQIFEYR